ncbi:hypothetical protein G6F16_013262 [Rhizopus arrhizus]|nr:hypothetical protein G6F16_013262 [Rhizopus arrhizus]
MVIPCTIEVLPSCPSHLILGSNWLNRAKAKIDFNSSSLKVKYKNQKAELPIHFIRKSTPLPKMKTFHQDYQHPISLTNSHSDKHVHFEDSDLEGSYSSTEDESESESEETSDDDIEMEITALERNHEQESLQVLENDKYEEVVITNSQEMYSIKSTDTGLLVQAHSSKHISLDKSKEDSQNILYDFYITHPKLMQSSGYFDQSSSFIVNKKSLDIRIYNRTENDIYLEPGEEIGILEAHDLNDDTIINAYEVDRNSTLCTLEHDIIEQNLNKEDQDTLKPQLLEKLEIGDINKSMKEELLKLLKRYQHIFDWDNDTIGLTARTESVLWKQNTFKKN